MITHIRNFTLLTLTSLLAACGSSDEEGSGGSGGAAAGNGGQSSAGADSGGSSSGGADNGGSNSGGAESGGSNSGGSNSGGAGGAGGGAGGAAGAGGGAGGAAGAGGTGGSSSSGGPDGYDVGGGTVALDTVTCIPNAALGSYLISATATDGTSVSIQLGATDRPTTEASYDLKALAINFEPNQANVTYTDDGGIPWWSQGGTVTTEIDGDALTVVLDGVTVNDSPTMPGESLSITGRVTCGKERISTFALAGNDTCEGVWTNCSDNTINFGTGLSGCNPAWTMSLFFPSGATPAGAQTVTTAGAASVGAGEVYGVVIGGATGTTQWVAQSGTVTAETVDSDELKVTFTDLPINDGSTDSTVTGELYCRLQ